MNDFECLPKTVTLSGQCVLHQREQLPSTSGIYFITKQNRLLYIGKAINLRSRWTGTGHHRYKQLATKGLDKIIISYILAPVTELDRLERQYIQALKPLLNDGRVKDYLPKKSSRLSELQRLLKLVNTPLFPRSEFKSDRQGNSTRRSTSDLIRGFVAGTYTANGIPHIVMFGKQNMGQILGKSSTHRTKRRFYVEQLHVVNVRGMVFYNKPIWKFDARSAIFEFIEFFSLGDYLFEQFYPHLEDCQILGVKLRKLTDTACIEPILKTLSGEEEKLARDYICGVCTNMQPLSADFTFDERRI